MLFDKGLGEDYHCFSGVLFIAAVLGILELYCVLVLSVIPLGVLGGDSLEFYGHLRS